MASAGISTFLQLPGEAVQGFKRRADSCARPPVDGFKLKGKNAVVGCGEARLPHLMRVVAGVVHLQHGFLVSLGPDQLQDIGVWLWKLALLSPFLRQGVKRAVRGVEGKLIFVLVQEVQVHAVQGVAMPDKVFVERLGAAERFFQAAPFVHEGSRHGQHVIVERRHRSNGHMHALVKTGAPRPPAATRHWRFRIEERQPFVADKIGGGEQPAAAVFGDFKKAKGRLAQEIRRFHLCAADFAGADGAVDRGVPAHGRRKKKHVDRIARSIHGAQRHVGGIPQSTKKIRGLGLDLCRNHALHRLLAAARSSPCSFRS